MFFLVRNDEPALTNMIQINFVKILLKEEVDVQLYYLIVLNFFYLIFFTFIVTHFYSDFLFGSVISINLN